MVNAVFSKSENVIHWERLPCSVFFNNNTPLS